MFDKIKVEQESGTRIWNKNLEQGRKLTDQSFLKVLLNKLPRHFSWSLHHRNRTWDYSNSQLQFIILNVSEYLSLLDQSLRSNKQTIDIIAYNFGHDPNIRSLNKILKTDMFFNEHETVLIILCNLYKWRKLIFVAARKIFDKRLKRKKAIRISHDQVWKIRNETIFMWLTQIICFN